MISSSPSLAHLPPMPGPRGHWLLGHLTELKHDALETFTDVQRTHGDMVRLKMLGLGELGARFDLHVLSHPDDIAYVLHDNAANYLNAGLLRRRYHTLFGPCILAAEGHDWQKRRKLEAPAFSRSRLNEMAVGVTDEAEVTIKRWETRLENNASFNAVPDMMELSMRVAGRMLLSTDFGLISSSLESERVIMARHMDMVCLQENLPVVNQLPKSRRFVSAKARTENLMIEIIERRRARLEAGEEENDLLDILIKARDANGIGWTNHEITGEIHAITRAGQDTTASSVVWALLMLARHPEFEKCLLAELNDVLEGQIPTAADLPRLPYLRAVYDEALRMFPPIPMVVRTAENDDCIGGHRVRKGGVVVLVSWLTQRDARWWSEPEKFDPDRFFNRTKNTERPRYAYFPFGGGPRFCLGAGLALLQGPLILASLMQKFAVRVPDNFEIRPKIHIAVLPEGGLPVTLERR